MVDPHKLDGSRISLSLVLLVALAASACGESIVTIPGEEGSDQGEEWMFDMGTPNPEDMPKPLLDFGTPQPVADMGQPMPVDMGPPDPPDMRMETCCPSPTPFGLGLGPD